MKVVRGPSFSDCCDDRIYTEEAHSAVHGLYVKCKEENGDEASSCIHTCVFRNLGFYSDNGIDYTAMKQMLGPSSMIGEPNDWKKTGIEKWIDECSRAAQGGQECSQDVKDLTQCFWMKVFTNCPSYNAANC